MFCRLGVLNAFLASDSFNLIWVCQDVTTSKDFLGGSVVKNLPAVQELQFDSWIRKIPWRREWQPTPIFLPGESHEQRSLAGYSPQGCIELDMPEATEYACMV